MADGPAMLGQYELEGLLGEGGIGQVFAAQDSVLGRKVAIKMLRPELARDENFVERFYTEAKSLGTLNHTNITTIYSLHTDGPDAFMVMELVHGYTLEALLAKVKRLTLHDTLAILAQTVAGIRYAHRRGLIHRDLKPANLMLTDDGLVKIMDFGIARVQGSQHLTRVGEFCGTFVYASPEQIRGEEVDERSDLYSLAIVVYRMLAGEAPFAATNEYALMTAQLQTPPPPLAGRAHDLDAGTEAILMQALAKRPDDRFASVEEFGKAIGALALRGESVEILTLLYARAFDGSENLEATRIVSSGRFRTPARDQTMPSNRRTWQLPTMGSGAAGTASPGSGSAQNMVLSRPSVAPPVSNARERRPSAAPVTAAPRTADIFQPALATPQPAASRNSRPLLLGVSVVAVSLLLGGGYYFAAGTQTTPPLREAVVQPDPIVAPAKPADPASIQPAVGQDTVTTPRPDPIPVVTVKSEPLPPPIPPAPDIPLMALVAIPTVPAPPEPPMPPPALKVVESPPPPIVEPPPIDKHEPVIVPPPAVAPERPTPQVVTVVAPPIPDMPKTDMPKTEPAPSTGEVKMATLEPKTPEPPPSPGPQPSSGPPKPEGEPDLLGKVLGAKGIDELEVAGRWVKIYGIVDNASGAREATHVQALLRYLKPAHGIVACYRKAGATHRCYADGRDIASLALHDRLARLAPNAPAEYRALFAQKR